MKVLGSCSMTSLFAILRKERLLVSPANGRFVSFGSSLASLLTVVLKVPAILYMERAGMHENLDFSGLPDEIDPSILSRDTSISLSENFSLVYHYSVSDPFLLGIEINL
jgi:hypothetical protein